MKSVADHAVSLIYTLDRGAVSDLFQPSSLSAREAAPTTGV